MGKIKERHPEAFERAKNLEKNALDHGSPFTWSEESLQELEKRRVEQIRNDYEKEKHRL